jgi:DNA-binding response OmpR family regulator
VAQIVVVEDEVALNNLIRRGLEAEGHTVRQAFDGPSSLLMVEESPPQLVILDWMLPGLDGLSVCRQLRQSHLMPIIMLTARAEEVDRVMGLEVGADDYVVKPFGMRELLARTRAALRRVELDARAGAPGAAEVGEAPIVQGPLRLDRGAHNAELEGARLTLTPKEFDLLALFAANPGRAFNREFLIDRIWGGDFEGIDRVVDNHIRGLRKKLGGFGDSIETVWGVGYRFRASSRGSAPR